MRFFGADMVSNISKGIIRRRKSKKRKYKKRQTISYKTKYRKLKIEQHEPTKTGDELRCFGRVISSCSICDAHCVTLVTNPVINHEWGKDRIVITTSGTYPWSFVTHIFHNGQPSHGGDRKTFEVMTST